MQLASPPGGLRMNSDFWSFILALGIVCVVMAGVHLFR